MRALVNEPSFIQNIGDRGVRTNDEARTYIALEPMASYARFGFGLYLVELKGSGTPIGICGILKRDELPGPDLGFAFLPAYWAQGYAFESATAVKTYARDVLGLTRLLAIVHPDNGGSIRLLERLGFRFEAMHRPPEDPAALRLFAAEPL